MRREGLEGQGRTGLGQDMRRERGKVEERSG
jgi:hypothetical protein